MTSSHRVAHALVVPILIASYSPNLDEMAMAMREGIFSRLLDSVDILLFAPKNYKHEKSCFKDDFVNGIVCDGRMKPQFFRPLVFVFYSQIV